MQNLQNFNPGDAQKYLSGVSFPASKEQVTSALKNNGAPNEIVQKLESAAKSQFSNEGDVMSALSGM